MERGKATSLRTTWNTFMKRKMIEWMSGERINKTCSTKDEK
jgi:hypothetical protein